MIKILEHQIQSAFFQYVRTKAAINPDYQNIFAIPNGGKLPYNRKADGTINSPQRVKLVAEGMEKGVLDTFVAVPAHDYHGLFIEFKRIGGKITPDQLKWARRLTKKGYLVKVIDNIDDAIKLIDWYLK